MVPMTSPAMSPSHMMAFAPLNRIDFVEMSTAPRISSGQLLKDEPSPKTPTLSTQGQTFLSASQRTPPRSHMAESDSSLISIDMLPAYDFSVQYSVPHRHQYEEREQSNVFDSSIFTQVYHKYRSFADLSRELLIQVRGPFRLCGMKRISGFV
jgi:hypothetical protein